MAETVPANFASSRVFRYIIGMNIIGIATLFLLLGYQRSRLPDQIEIELPSYLNVRHVEKGILETGVLAIDLKKMEYTFWRVYAECSAPSCVDAQTLLSQLDTTFRAEGWQALSSGVGKWVNADCSQVISVPLPNDIVPALYIPDDMTEEYSPAMLCVAAWDDGANTRVIIATRRSMSNKDNTPSLLSSF